MDWLEFTAAFAAFFLTHSIPLRPAVRPHLQRALGRRGFTLAYSALSLAVLGWLIAAAGRAPFVPLWTWAPWQHLVPLAVMLPVCLILSLAIARPNPLRPFNSLGCIVCRSGLYSLPVLAKERQDALENQY